MKKSLRTILKFLQFTLKKVDDEIFVDWSSPTGDGVLTVRVYNIQDDLVEDMFKSIVDIEDFIAEEFKLALCVIHYTPNRIHENNMLPHILEAHKKRVIRDYVNGEIK